MCFEDPSVIEEYVKAHADGPMPRKRVGNWSIALSHNDFGTLKSYWTSLILGSHIAETRGSPFVIRYGRRSTTLQTA